MPTKHYEYILLRNSRGRLGMTNYILCTFYVLNITTPSHKNNICMYTYIFLPKLFIDFWHNNILSTCQYSMYM